MFSSVRNKMKQISFIQISQRENTNKNKKEEMSSTDYIANKKKKIVMKKNIYKKN